MPRLDEGQEGLESSQTSQKRKYKSKRKVPGDASPEAMLQDSQASDNLVTPPTSSRLKKARKEAPKPDNKAADLRRATWNQNDSANNNPFNELDIIRQQLVTLKFSNPKPTSLGNYDTWTETERQNKRRLVAITASCDTRRYIITLNSTVVESVEDAPPESHIVSCIYSPPDSSEMPNTCVITSNDVCNLVIWMVVIDPGPDNDKKKSARCGTE